MNRHGLDCECHYCSDRRLAWTAVMVTTMALLFGCGIAALYQSGLFSWLTH